MMYILVIILVGMIGCLLVLGFGIDDDLTYILILGAKNKKEALEFIIFGMGGVVAAIVAVAINRRANPQARNNKLIEKGHINDRFQHATINLWHEKRHVLITFFYLFIIAAFSVMLAMLIADSDKMTAAIHIHISYHAELVLITSCLIVILFIIISIVIMPQSHSKNSIKARFQRSDFVFWGTAFMWSIVVLMLLMFVLAIRSDNMLMWISNLLGTAKETIATEQVVAINTVKSETLKFIGLGISGMVVAIGAIAFNRRADAEVTNNKLTEKGHINDRFQQATENLGHKELTVRIASFYQFYYLASKNMRTQKKTQEFRESIFEILCSYLRVLSHKIRDSKENEREYLDEEFQTLFDILFKDKFKAGEAILINHAVRPNLQRIHLPYIQALGANLSYTNLSHANLSDGIFIEANLSHTRLWHAKFPNALLMEANLSHADLLKADLSGASLSGANLSEADLSEAKFPKADLSGTNLSGANLSEANFTLADLSGTDLSGADLSGADLSGANFQDAHLKNVELQDVRSISKANFYGARVGDREISPKDLPMGKGRYIAPWADDEFWKQIEKNRKNEV